MRDAHQRKRRIGTYGENHHQAKLTTQQVQEIRSAYAQGDGVMVIASRYPVGYSQISMIVHRKRRVWVDD